MVKLDVYIADDCWSCEETQRIVAHIAAIMPQVNISTFNLSDENTERPAEVFATPTYVINDRVTYLGNPTQAELRQKLEAIRQKEVINM